MSPRRVAAAALVLGVAGALIASTLAPRLSAQGSPERLTPYPKTLPPGEGAALVNTNCVLCHSTMLITQQRKDSTAWEKSVQLMERWGARLVPDDHAKVISYLVANFGPTAPKQ